MRILHQPVPDALAIRQGDGGGHPRGEFGEAVLVLLCRHHSAVEGNGNDDLEVDIFDSFFPDLPAKKESLVIVLFVETKAIAFPHCDHAPECQCVGHCRKFTEFTVFTDSNTFLPTLYQVHTAKYPTDSQPAHQAHIHFQLVTSAPIFSASPFVTRGSERGMQNCPFVLITLACIFSHLTELVPNLQLPPRAQDSFAWVSGFVDLRNFNATFRTYGSHTFLASKPPAPPPQGTLVFPHMKLYVYRGIQIDSGAVKELCRSLHLASEYSSRLQESQHIGVSLEFKADNQVLQLAYGTVFQKIYTSPRLDKLQRTVGPSCHFLSPKHKVYTVLIYPVRYVVMMNAYNRIPDNPFAVRASLKRGAAVRRKQSRQTFPSNRLLDSTPVMYLHDSLAIILIGLGSYSARYFHVDMSLVITCDGRLPSDTYPHTDELFAVRASFKHDIPDAVPVGSVTFESRIQDFDYTSTSSSTVILERALNVNVTNFPIDERISVTPQSFLISGPYVDEGFNQNSDANEDLFAKIPLALNDTANPYFSLSSEP
ncbi:hypothetical protein EV360DRAFT_72753 [Lentinula raphanica]|nr:hypothetical protein EV360DRAFT_72753 [Lentinula raphanica]